MAGRGGTETSSYQDYDQGANSLGPIGEFGTEFEPQPPRMRAADEGEEDEGADEDAGDEEAGDEEGSEEEEEE